MGVLSLNYRRPEYIDKQQFRESSSSINTNDEKSDASLKSGRSGALYGIPDALTFDKIIDGGTCPPCTIRDFMNYLLYIEHSAENLQFFLWYRDYVRRFNEASTSDVLLAQEWTQAMEDETLAKIQREAADKLKKDPKAADIFKGTDFEKNRGDIMIMESRDPFATPPPTPSDEDTPSIYSQVSSYRSQAQDAFAAAGVKQPFTIQPFRGEINRVIATYIVTGSPRQLNLSAREQKAAVQALAYTTHPSALRAVAAGIENTLRRQAHPNFVRWSICNGNPARGAFARQLGVSVIALTTLGAVVLTLSAALRAYRALFAVGWVLGIATLVTACKGMCVVLHGLHHRQVRPWELFLDADAEADVEAGTDVDSQDEKGGKDSFDSFGSANSYEDQPWVVKYERRNLVRKVFDREVWIQEPALRQIQDTIALQSLLCALLGAAVLTVVFVAVPGGRFF
ncbi:hypothetical protein F5B20DRAFT_592810 [Whalleya microplaca]|nr:hypothetical protein F5B20DRAFT_592810 [Whalleya microplaca]